MGFSLFISILFLCCKKKIESLILLFYQSCMYSIKIRTKSDDFEEHTSKSYSCWNNAWIEIACSGKTLTGQIIVVHRSPIFQNSKARGKQVQVKTKKEWSRRKMSSDTIEIAFVTKTMFFLRQVQVKFFYQNFACASFWKIRSSEIAHLKQFW